MDAVTHPVASATPNKSATVAGAIDQVVASVMPSLSGS